VKAVILAGGFATRLYPLTLNIPKPLLRLNGKVVLDIIMEKLSEIKLDKIYLTINEKFRKDFEEWVNERKHENIEIKVEKAMKNEEKPGAILALSYLIEEMKGHDSLIVAADNVFTESLQNIFNFFKKVNASTIGVYDLRSLEEVKKYSSIVLDESSKIVEFEEKPKNPKSTLIGTGIYFMKEEDFQIINDYVKAEPDKDHLGNLIAWLIKRKPVYAYRLSGIWIDIGSFESYELAKKLFG
jgi:Nucleoside-diphosphate-sugar pyrophosphorylase involved in lipopolysaccharide biosynthesis/translation initiation factor 2B, gamma/epsilon subunits (eIF-2Bgamma/eIF-2Bepsilon)